LPGVQTIVPPVVMRISAAVSKGKGLFVSNNSLSGLSHAARLNIRVPELAATNLTVALNHSEDESGGRPRLGAAGPPELFPLQQRAVNSLQG